MNFLFLRTPLFDSNALSERLIFSGKILIDPVGLVLWILAFWAGFAM